MRRAAKRLSIIGLIICFLTVPLSQSKVQAASLGQQLVYGGIAIALVTSYFNTLNDKDQQGMLHRTEKQTGVYHNEYAEERIDSIANQLKTSGMIHNNYAIYANPEKDFNAFCTLGHVISVNRGALDTLDDDELAAVLGHEMAHGEQKHPVKGVTKMVGLGLAIDLYLGKNDNNTSAILSGIAGNVINNEVFTMNQEWEADNLGFGYSSAAGFNPGAGAASMVKLRSMYGELHHEGLVKVISPNNHPKTSDRVSNFAKKMTEFSNGHVTVKKDATIQIDGHDIVTPVKTSRYLAGERAYLIAGNISKVYHSNALDTATVGENGTIYIGNQAIMTPDQNDISADEIVNSINVATGK